MPRLFTALEVPPPVAAELATMRGGIPGARWIAPADYHLTLRFIGDIDDAMARDIHDALEDVEAGRVAVTLTGLVAFGGAKPRAIVMAAKPDDALMALHDEQERLMRRVGLAPEARKFMPHITLARLRQTSSFVVGDYLASQNSVALPRFEAHWFVLMSARASVGGGPYVREAVFPLT